MTFSSLSPPPMRGYVVHLWGSILRPLDIVGVVVKTVVRRSEEGPASEDAVILPVVFDVDFVREPDGGLSVVDPDFGYWSDFPYRVLWCWWPATEDEARLEALRPELSELAQEAEDARYPLAKLAREQGAPNKLSQEIANLNHPTATGTDKPPGGELRSKLS